MTEILKIRRYVIDDENAANEAEEAAGNGNTRDESSLIGALWLPDP